MTKRAPATEPVWISDDELIQRLNVPEKIARENLLELDRKAPSFPKKQKLWGDCRYWPAVKAWFEQTYGLRMSSAQTRRDHAA